jgi:Uma2 family endonuclease
MEAGMSGVATKPLTIAEFDKLDLPADRKWELHNGELVEMAFPALIHKRLQRRFSHLLERLFPDCDVLEEYPFQIEETNDKRSADVGMTTKERGQAALVKGVLVGAPELVVEVLSPSNTVPELKRLRRLCFEHGTLIFLTLDPDDNTVEVHLTASKPDYVLGIEDTLQLALFGEQKAIPVAEIFRVITLTEG